MFTKSGNLGMEKSSQGTVSVIMPAFNNADFISEAIDSKGTGSVDQTRQTVHKLADELVFSGHGLATLEKVIAEGNS